MICYELFSGRKPFGQIHPIEAARRASVDNARPQWTPSHVNKYVCCIEEWGIDDAGWAFDVHCEHRATWIKRQGGSCI